MLNPTAMSSVNPALPHSGDPNGNANLLSSMGPQGQQKGFDIWGPLQRRKYLIVLFSIVGAVLGYLHYSKTPKVYNSSAQLLVSTQAPPSMVDGNFKLETVSLPKHVSLVSSELVLANASENGKFDRLKTFEGISHPVSELSAHMLRVVPGTQETFTLACSGPEPEELPIILNQIIASYKAIIVEDSQTVGEETTDLIEKLAARMSDEKDGAEAERFELWKKLGVNSVLPNGQAVNPFTKKLDDLVDQQEAMKRQLRETQERAKLLASALKADEETGLISGVHVRVAALEAQKYLELDRAVFTAPDSLSANVDSEVRKRNVLEQRIWALATQITDLRFEKVRRSEIYGSGHNAIGLIERQIGFYDRQRAELAKEVEVLSAYIDKQIATAEGQGDAVIAAHSVDEQTFRMDEDREWITMYQLALEREQARLVSSLNTWNAEIEKTAKSAESVADGIVRLNLLQSKIEEKRRAVNVILDRLSEMSILANNYSRTKVRILHEPKHGYKIAPSLAKSAAMGAMLGFLLGFGLAMLIDQSELSFRSPHEIFEKLGIPVVGRIPRIDIREIDPMQGNASLITAHKPEATASESFRDVRTGLFFRASMDGIKAILFTSPSPGDGKSTTTGNIAISIAQAGKRVILVDADFRRPRVDQYFGEEISPGLLDVFSGEVELNEAIQPAELQENLFLLTSGGRPRNPGELVTSEAFRELVGALRDRFDYVLIDSPPVLPVSDSATIASMVDGVYLVTRIRKGVKLATQKAKESLDRVGANWMGIIVNGIDENPHYSEYGHQYGSYSYYGGVYGRYYESHNKAYRNKIVDPADDLETKTETTLS